MPLWASFFVVLGCLASVFAALRLWQGRQPAPSPELVRKAAHIATGLVAASFPWLFDRVWPGIVLCMLTLAGMVLVHVTPRLRGTIGRVTGSVERRSWGEFYFPLAIAVVWGLSRRDPVLYVAPILLLTLGDAAAALVGVAYGRHKFRTSEGLKSIEGSLTFWVVGFVVTLAAFRALRPELDSANAILIAILLGGLLLVFEAISWRGLDNLILPIAALALLQTYLDLDPRQLAQRIAAFGLIFGILLFYRSRMTLIGEGLLASALFLYGAWALGGWKWLAPPAMVVLALAWLPHRGRAKRSANYGVFSVAAVTGPGLALLLGHLQTRADIWPAYVASFAAALAVVLVVQTHGDKPNWPPLWGLIGAALLSACLVGSVSAASARVPLAMWWSLVALGVTAAAVALPAAFAPILIRSQVGRHTWVVRGLGMWLGSAAALGLSGAILEGSTP
jgi:phytol kinase